MDAIFDKFAKIPMLQKLLGLILAALVLSLIVYALLISPAKSEQDTLRATINGLQADLANKRKTVGDLTQYKREVEKLNQDLQKALKLLPNQAEIPSLLQKISALAQKSGLEIQRFQPNPEVVQDFYAKVPVSLSLRGTYTEITNFFDAVGKLSRIVNVGSINLSVSAAAEKAGASGISSKKVLTATCVATTFRFVPQADAAPAAQ